MSARVVMLLAVVVGWLPLAASANQGFWTTPDPLVAGQPTRVVFTTFSYGGQPTVDVAVEGNVITFALRNLCGEEICLSAKVPAAAAATLPALAAGTYTVVLVPEDVYDDPPSVRATLEVQEGALPVRVLPADGFWAPVGEPGSGLFLERRGDLLAVSLYTYRPQDASPFWMLGTGSYAGDDAPLLVRAYANGDCLGCTTHQAPTAGPANVLVLHFESARRATADIPSAGDDIPLVSLPYGVDYVPHTLTDTVDDRYGPLPLPDLSGRWIFTIENAEAPLAYEWVSLGDFTEDGGVITFSGSIDVECRSATDTQRAGCFFVPGFVTSPPSPEPLNTFHGAGWFAPLGDIEEDRIRGVFEAEGTIWRVQGFRTSGS
jgi:hypothetical protein